MVDRQRGPSFGDGATTLQERTVSNRPLEAVQRQSLEAQTYETMRRAILRGDLPAGRRLVQGELAAELGTSRIPVRDALKRLQTDGLVTVDGRVVSTPGEKVDLRLVVAMKRGRRIVVSATDAHGDVAIDTFSLMGFTKALDAVAERCRG